MSQELLVLLTAAAPVSELRGSIPLAILKFGFPAYKAVAISLIGNMLPVPFILMFLEPFARRVRHLPVFEKFFCWLYERTKRKADLVQKYEALGLMLFVAVPLPITGAWTGAIAATLFKIKFRYSLLAIFLGVIIASVIVTILTLTGSSLFLKKL